MKNNRMKLALLMVAAVNFLIYGVFTYLLDANIINLTLDKAYKAQQIDYAMTRMSNEYYDIEYSHMERGVEVVYVQGHYPAFAHHKLIKGRYIASGDYESVLLSKDLASSRFRTYDCIGNDYLHRGVVYKVIGVLDTSSKLVFTLPDHYQDGAEKVRVRIGVSQVQEAQIAQLRSWFRVKGITVNLSVVNQWYIQSFRNLGIGLLMVMLINEIIGLVLKCYGFFQYFYQERNKEKLVFEIKTFYGKNKMYVFKFIGDTSILVVLTVVLFALGTNLMIPTYLLPEDPTRISLWVSVVEKLLSGLTYQVRFGLELATLYALVFALVDIVAIGLIVSLVGKSRAKQS